MEEDVEKLETTGELVKRKMSENYRNSNCSSLPDCSRGSRLTELRTTSSSGVMYRYANKQLEIREETVG